MEEERLTSESSVPKTVDTDLTCVFWNTHRRDLQHLIPQLAAHARADVVVLAESGAIPDLMLGGLRRVVDQSYHEPQAETRRIQLFARRTAFDLREVYGDVSGRVTIRILRFQGTEFLFAAAHLPNKLHWSTEGQIAEVQVLADQIRRVEDDHGHRRTILVGDLNMNPFEAGVVQASGLHAMMTKATVQAGSRTVQGREYPFFYNPMWSFFGDRTPGPPGSYFYRHGGHLSYDWNIFDQVLIRPDALPWFRGDLDIVTRIGEIDLLQPDGRPNVDLASDHLPIVFRLATTN